MVSSRALSEMGTFLGGHKQDHNIALEPIPYNINSTAM